MTLAALPPRAFPFPVADDKLTLPDDIVVVARPWMAIIAIDSRARGGFARTFLRNRGATFTLIDKVERGAALELSNDYAGDHGKVIRRRYFTVLLAEPERLVLQEHASGEAACLAAPPVAEPATPWDAVEPAPHRRSEPHVVVDPSAESWAIFKDSDSDVPARMAASPDDARTIAASLADAGRDPTVLYYFRGVAAPAVEVEPEGPWLTVPDVLMRPVAPPPPPVVPPAVLTVLDGALRALDAAAKTTGAVADALAADNLAHAKLVAPATTIMVAQARDAVLKAIATVGGAS